MKIVDRKTFLQMPEGTVFCKIPLNCKGDGALYPISICSPWVKNAPESDVDFFYTDLGGDMAPYGNCSKTIDVLFDMVKTLGKEIPFETCSGRDGLYEDGNVGFAIFSKSEVEEMIGILQEALENGYKDELI